MMASLNGTLFRITGPLCGEFTGHWWIPRTKASDAKLWCFLWSAPWINGWVKNREVGDLIRHRAHYDVTIMLIPVYSGLHHREISMTFFSGNIQRTRRWLWYRTLGIINSMHANSDDLICLLSTYTNGGNLCTFTGRNAGWRLLQ